MKIHFTRTALLAIISLCATTVLCQRQPAGLAPNRTLEKIVQVKQAQDSFDKRVDSITIRLNKAIAAKQRRDLVKKNRR
jgi:hypothetical protein